MNESGDPMLHLFAYGSLRPGYANEHILSELGGEWCAANIRGKWFEEGWGFVNHGLRGLVVDRRGEEIIGQIFLSLFSRTGQPCPAE